MSAVKSQKGASEEARSKIIVKIIDAIGCGLDARVRTLTLSNAEIAVLCGAQFPGNETRWGRTLRGQRVTMSIIPRTLLLLMLLLVAATGSAQTSVEERVDPATTAADSLEALRTALITDTALQNATIIALRTALGAREQIAVVRRGRFTDDIRFYLESFRGIRDATIQSTIQNRYSAARADLLEPRLPASIAQLVELLETLE